MANQPLLSLSRGIQRCQRCERSETRQHAVPGEGNEKASIILLGEAPGKKEDASGQPFVGRAGTYLDKVLTGYDFDRKELYITSVLKCYHPSNIKEHQLQACYEWTEQQLLAIQPDVIFVMGKAALNGLLHIKKPLSEIESATWHNIPCIITCHPASAMRFPERDTQFRKGLQRLAAFIQENPKQS